MGRAFARPLILPWTWIPPLWREDSGKLASSVDGKTPFEIFPTPQKKSPDGAQWRRKPCKLAAWSHKEGLWASKAR